MLRNLARAAQCGLVGAANRRIVVAKHAPLASTSILARFKSTKNPHDRHPATITPTQHVHDEEDDEDEGMYDDEEEDGDEWEYDERRRGQRSEGATVGDIVPDFTAEQVAPSGTLRQYNSFQDMENRYTIMLFYPADFTFVCPTELTAFSDSVEQFRKLDCDVVGISTDQIHSHVAWLKLARNAGGVEGLKIPLLADPTQEITKAFGVLNEKDGQARRATVIVNKDCEIIHTSVNHAPVGRSVEEALRLIKAFRFVDEHGDQVCPASWQPGKKTIVDNHNDKMEYFSSLQ